MTKLPPEADQIKSSLCGMTALISSLRTKSSYSTEQECSSVPAFLIRPLGFDIYPVEFPRRGTPFNWVNLNFGFRHLALYMFFLILLLVFSLHPLVATGDQTETDYRRSRASFERLLKDPQKQKHRLNWIACIRGFRSVYEAQPSGPWADDS